MSGRSKSEKTGAKRTKLRERAEQDFIIADTSPEVRQAPAAR
jgi:hypothetical protein